MKDFLVSLRTMAWRTAGARYNAARRLKRREWFSTFSLASLSALSIAVAFAQRIYSPQSGTPLDNYLTAMSVSLDLPLPATGAVNACKGTVRRLRLMVAASRNDRATER